METKELKKFEKPDIDNCKVFRALIEKGEFKLTGGAVLRVASLFDWFYKLEGKIEGALKQQLLDGAPKIKETK